MSQVCSHSVNIKRTWTDGNNSVMQLKNALWHLAIYSSGLCFTLSLSLITWVETLSLFSASPVCCKVFVMSVSSHLQGHQIYLLCWESNRLRRSLNPSRHAFFPNQDWRASAIQYLVYRIARDKSSNQHLQRHKANPQTRKCTSDLWRNPTHYRRKICCSFNNCLLCNEHTGGSFAVASFTGIWCCFYFN